LVEERTVPDVEYSYRNLVLWQNAQALALEVIQLTAALPRSAANDVLTRQIIRSATSIGANIAEGHGRYTPRAHAQHLSIAKGSACETDSWLDLLKRSGLISDEAEARLHARCNELIGSLTAKIRSLWRVAADSRLEDERGEYVVEEDGSRFEVLGSSASEGMEADS
jgi:four helix bundle protein